MLAQLIEGLINFYQGYIIIYFCDNFFSGKKNTTAKISFIAAIGVFLCLRQFFNLQIPIVVAFLFGLAYLILTKKGTFIGRIICISLLASLWVTVTTLLNSFSTYISKIYVTNAPQNEASRIPYLITFCVFITICFFAICKIVRHNQHANIPVKYNIFFSILLLAEGFASALLLVLFSVSRLSSTFAFVCILLLFVITIMSLVIYESFFVVLKKAITNENKNRMLIESKLHQTDIVNMYQALLKNQHDIKHLLNVAESLLSKSDPVALAAGKKVLESSIPTSDTFLTGNITMDAILTAKKEIAQANNIAFHYQPYPLTVLPIDELSFCVLVSNLLDNSIQEQLRLADGSDDRYISLKFARNHDMFSITCINPTLEDQKDISEAYINSRKETGHGYGLESIRQTVIENQGMCYITSENCLFSVEILLPMRDQTNVEHSN